MYFVCFSEPYDPANLASRTFLERLLERYQAVEEKRRLNDKRKEELNELDAYLDSKCYFKFSIPTIFALFAAHSPI